MAHAHIRRPGRPRTSKRLLALAGEDRLVEEVRRGNEAAFEVIYERHSGQLLSFCRHMLGSRESGEEALQHTFAAAWADLQRSDRPIQLKPWLYRIARNRCISIIRSRRIETAELDDPPATEGLADEVARRSDLRALLADLRDLPDEHRAALLLSELGGFSHADIAEVIGRREDEVKALVFRARSTLADWRIARDTPCEEIREQLATLHGGALRRRPIQRHLQGCPGCRSFREEVKAQRRMMGVVLPVVPTIGLKDGVLAAIGVGGAGGAAAGAGGLAAGTLGTASVAKVVAVAVAVGGAAGGGQALLDSDDDRAPASVPAAAPGSSSGAGSAAPGEEGAGAAPGSAAIWQRKAGERGVAKRDGRRRGEGFGGGASALAPPATPVRARGEPPALGRLKQGKPPPPAGHKPKKTRVVKMKKKLVAPKSTKPKPVRPAPERRKPREDLLVPQLKPDKAG